MSDLQERQRLVSVIVDAIEAHTREDDGHVDGGCIENLFEASGWQSSWGLASVAKEVFAAIANSIDDDHLLEMSIAAEGEIQFAKEIQAERAAVAALEALGVDPAVADKLVSDTVRRRAA